MTFGLENRIPVHEQEGTSGQTEIEVQAKETLRSGYSAQEEKLV